MMERKLVGYVSIVGRPAIEALIDIPLPLEPSLPNIKAVKHPPRYPDGA